MSTSARWTLAVLTVVAALVTGLVIELHRVTPPHAAGPTAGEQARPAAGPDLTDVRKRADLPPCSAGVGGPAALRGVVVECAADGAPVDVAAMFAGRRVVVNLWAYWCVPCREELPAMVEYQRRAGRGVLVVTVHQDDNQAAALALLAELGVRLPTLQDGRRQIAAALRVPNVMPATVVLAPDGSVARILPQSFADAEEIAAAVGDRER